MQEFIGIDFGTIHFRTGIFRSGQFEVIKNYYDEHEYHLFLRPEKNDRKNNLTFPVLCGIKQLFGMDLKNSDAQKNINVLLGGLFETIFEEIKGNLKSEIINGVITVPCYYHDRERSGLITLAENNGFNQIRLLDENVALAVGQNLRIESKNVFIYSLGADLFSCTLLKYENGNYRTLNSGCNNDLSGSYFDSVILKIVCNHLGYQFHNLNKDELNFLISLAFKAKKELSELQETILPFEPAVRRGLFLKSHLRPERNIIITRKEFEELSVDFITETIQLCIKTINDTGNQKENIDLVLLAGGATRIPIVQKMVKDVFNTEIVIADTYATSRGAAVFASTLPVPPVKIKNPVKQIPKKADPEPPQTAPSKSGDYASQWVKNYADELEAYHQLWLKEAYPESIEKMELVRQNVTKFVAHLCHIAGKKYIDKGLNKEALGLLRKGYSYDKTDLTLTDDLLRCYNLLIIDSLNNKDYQTTRKLLADALNLDPGNKEWRKLMASLRNISKNKLYNSKY